jgi:hypothetical protein
MGGQSVDLDAAFHAAGTKRHKNHAREWRQGSDAYAASNGVAQMTSVAQALAERERRIDHIERRQDEMAGEAALTAAQRAEIAAIRKRAKPIFDALSLPTPNPAEKPIVYRVRVAAQLQRHAKASDWARTDLANLARASPTAFANAEREIYALA